MFECERPKGLLWCLIFIKDLGDSITNLRAVDINTDEESKADSQDNIEEKEEVTDVLHHRMKSKLQTAVAFVEGLGKEDINHLKNNGKGSAIEGAIDSIIKQCKATPSYAAKWKAFQMEQQNNNDRKRPRQSSPLDQRPKKRLKSSSHQ